ncbi:hypothetical protein M3Y94_00504000 [Aphelenchoides besseyi]|nr:hypothetical protein M3Y94_00504000 [Aphelenchoides besseyi]
MEKRLPHWCPSKFSTSQKTKKFHSVLYKLTRSRTITLELVVYFFKTPNSHTPLTSAFNRFQLMVDRRS